jgi:hypothetical protein
MPSQQQDIQQPRTIQVGEMFLLKSDEKCAVGTFLQKGVGSLPLWLFQVSSADHWLKMIKALITGGEKMFEAETLRLERDQC